MAARNARDEKDLAKAEDLLRQARRQRERACKDPGDPLCESAKNMRDLGY
jgi:hypothetical protein